MALSPHPVSSRPARSPHAPRPLRRRTALGLLLFALLVRLLAWAPFAEVETLRGDEAYYVDTALALAAGEGHPGSFRPPLYPAFIAALLRLGGGLDAVRLGQVLLSTLLVGLVFDLAGRRFGGRAALAAGLACALEPALVHYSHFLWSEGFAAFLLVLTLWWLERWDEGRRTALLVAAGATLGLTALSKEIWLYYAAAAALWVAWRSAVPAAPAAARLDEGRSASPARASTRRASIAALVFALAAGATVLPWSVRNTLLHGALVPISTCRWFPIAVGNLLPEEDWLLGDGRGGEARRRAPAGLSELEAEAHWRQVALEAIRAEQPAWLAKKLARNGVRLWSVHSQTVRFIENGWIPGLSRPTARALLALEVALYALIVGAGIAGLWLIPDRSFKPLVLAAILLTVGVHTLANAIPRFHVPLLPFFALYAGALTELRAEPRARWRWAGAAVSLAFFTLLLAVGWERSLAPALAAVEKL